ncbi:MAG TPA: tetratricopeptide repeat protein [Candidatus Acidoferrales bacterium]|nr:tetratricopeptide repeat protein [Candidatus Acidoferrales bacterium]
MRFPSGKASAPWGREARGHCAIAQLRRTLELDPHFWAAHWDLGDCYLALGRNAEAIAELRKAVDLSAGSAGGLAMLGYAYGTTGERAKAEKVLQELNQRGRSQYVSPADVATVEFGLGHRDQAFAWLEKAYQDRAIQCHPLLALVIIDASVRERHARKTLGRSQ